MICGIITAPRPNQASYLRRTVQSLFAAGGKHVFVFAEPGSNLESISDLPAWRIERRKRLGNWRNWLSMATELVKLSRYDNILTCEDDVQFCGDAVPIADRILNETRASDVGPLLVYSSSVHQKEIQPGVMPIRGPSLIGSCALGWTRESLNRVTKSEVAQQWRGIDHQEIDEEIRHADTAIGLCCESLSLRMLAMNPCLAQHSGLISSLHPNSTTPDLFAAALLGNLV